MTISRWIHPRMRNVSNKSCRETQNTHFVFHKFFSENRAVYEIMSKNMVELERPQTIWRLRVEYWVSKDTGARRCTEKHIQMPAHICPHSRLHTQIEQCNGNSGFVNAPQCYVPRILPLLLWIMTVVTCLACVLHILKAPFSDVDLGTIYCGWGCLWFLLGPLSKCRDGMARKVTLPHNSSSTHWSSCHRIRYSL